MALRSRAATSDPAPALDSSLAADPGTAEPAQDVQTPQVQTYVIDTSVLLSDPGAFTRFAEHEVILPLVVISELEAKRHHSELGYFARQSLRILDDLRIAHGRLDAPVPIGTEGGTPRVELNHTDPAVLPLGFRTDGNDARILACALNLAAEGRDVTLGPVDLVEVDDVGPQALQARIARGDDVGRRHARALPDPGHAA